MRKIAGRSLGILFLFLLLLQAADAQAQAKTYTLKINNKPLATALQEVGKASGYGFFYKEGTIPAKLRVTADFANAPIEKILDRLLAANGFDYEIQRKAVLVTPHSPSFRKDDHPVSLSGIVQDENGEPLPGVTILLNNGSWGTTTGMNGEFKIRSTTSRWVLTFSFVGMQSQTLTYLTTSSKPDDLLVKLGENASSIEEVVVTGYQDINKKAMTGAYTAIKAEDLVITGSETIENMLQGQIPGMVVTNPSGQTGTRQQIRVRGTTTLNGNADPLWVVDGIVQEDPLPVEDVASKMNAADDNLDVMRDFIGSAVSWLNPNDIENITVLKDAVATAMYGVRAANGVIVVTTKRGGKDGKMAVRYDVGLTMSTRMNYKRQNTMNSLDRVALSREAWERGTVVNRNDNFGYIPLAFQYYVDRTISYEEFNEAVKRMESANTDWFDLLYRPAFSQSHNVSFSGRGGDNVSYYASVGYNDAQNTAKGNGQTAIRGSMRLDMTFRDKLQIQASLAGSRSETTAFAAGVDPYNYAMKSSRAIPCFDEDSPDGLFYYKDKAGWKYNILNELKNSGNENVVSSMNISFSARWHPLDFFTLSATAGGSVSTTNAESWFTENTNHMTPIRKVEIEDRKGSDLSASNVPFGGQLNTDDTKNYNWTLRLQPEFHKNINRLHDLSVMGGIEVRSALRNGHTATRYGYMPERGKTFVNVPEIIEDDMGTRLLGNPYSRGSASVSESKENSLGYYASVNYMYNNRYSANVSVRGDGSNAFGREGNFLPTWAFGLRWNVSEEAWMQNQNILNDLGLTASVGYQGAVVSGVPKELIAEFPVNSLDVSTGEFMLNISDLPKPGLKWEKTFNLNLGLNFGFFNNRVNGSFSWYYRTTKDLVSQISVPYEYGVATTYINKGDMDNRGWDMALSFVPVRTKDFTWSIGTSFSGNNNKIKSTVAEGNYSYMDAVNGNINKEGYPVGSFWAFRFKGLNPENGAPLIDMSRENLQSYAKDVTEYMVYMGTKDPKFTVGINMVLRYKRFSFPLNFYVSRGNYAFLASPYPDPSVLPSEYENVSADLNDRWRAPGDELHTDIPSIPTGENNVPLLLTWGEGNTNLQEVYPLEAWQYSNVRVVNAWFIRFNDFRFSYDLPEKWLKGAFHGAVRNIRVSATATNPLIIKGRDFKGRDPEVALGNQPRSQNYSLNLSFTF